MKPNFEITPCQASLANRHTCRNQGRPEEGSLPDFFHGVGEGGSGFYPTKRI